MGILVLVHVFGKTYMQARAFQMAAAVPETILSGTILFLASAVTWPQAGVALLASAGGAYLGSKVVIERGDNLIRIAIAVIGILMSLKVVAESLF